MTAYTSAFQGGTIPALTSNAFGDLEFGDTANSYFARLAIPCGRTNPPLIGNITYPVKSVNPIGPAWYDCSS